MVTSPFSLYIHIPFCSKKCPYCHFFVTSSKTKDEPRFIEALLKEWKLRFKSKKEDVITLYFGGGTPTELSTEGLSFLISTFKKEHPNLKEITVEANPESVSKEKIEALKNAGCNRISLGVQSFENNELISLKRQHHQNRAIEAIFEIKAAGIDNISIDLMYDIPHQSLKSFINTLQVIPRLPITHLSLYNLVIEENTPFKRIEKELKKKLPPEDESHAMLKSAIEHLEQAGFRRYEISAFCKPGFESIHNSGYWESRPFLGLGPSAFSDDTQTRSQNVCNLQQYYELVENFKEPIGFSECLSPYNRFKERFIVRLRMFKWLNIDHFIQIHGQPDNCFFNQIEDLEKSGWIFRNQNEIILTAKGADFFEDLAVSLV